MTFTANDFMRQFVKPVEHGITDVFHQASGGIMTTEHTIASSFDNVVNKTANSFDGITHLFNNPLVLLGIGAVAIFIITKK